ncbi:MAG: hypothetical protein IKY70_04755 [Bacteroidales bacterium]|nr:hypothetical protein [Bacteroidales bacterium]
MGRSPLYNFDVSGKFINRFSRIGRAYGEYQAVRMSHYDDISGKFTVVDINGKVLVYTLAGEFLYEIPTESLTGYIKVRDFLQLDGNIRKVSVGGTIQGETEDFVLLQITHIADYFDNIQPKERLNYLLFDKRNGTSSLMAKNNNDIHGFVNDIDNGAPFLPSKIADGKMYQIIDAASFIEFAKNSSSDKMKKVAATLTDESNPVIVVATLKH